MKTRHHTIVNDKLSVRTTNTTPTTKSALRQVDLPGQDVRHDGVCWPVVVEALTLVVTIHVAVECDRSRRHQFGGDVHGASDRRRCRLLWGDATFPRGTRLGPATTVAENGRGVLVRVGGQKLLHRWLGLAVVPPGTPLLTESGRQKTVVVLRSRPNREHELTIKFERNHSYRLRILTTSNRTRSPCTV